MAYGPLAAFGVATQEQERQKDRIRRLGLTERQLDLNRYWSYYCCTQHDSCSVDWSGRKRLTPIERDTVSRSAHLPPGFYDAGGMLEEIPLDLRKPTAPYQLVRVVVHRFTDLLFSDTKHPKISVAENQPVQSWLESAIESARLWIRMAHARNHGGGMGAVAVSFRFRNGRPIIDVHDIRWCTPTFVDETTGEIASLEIRYMYALEERDPKGVLREVWYWYRRVIDATRDVIFQRAPVGEGEEPMWAEQTVVDHGFGECPAVWIRNTQTNEVDGDPDCHGVFDGQDAIDRLISQADQGSVENADPTLTVTSDELRTEQIRKGSRNAFKLERGGSANYTEMSGSGVDSALKVADVHRRNFLEVVQCILDSEETSGAMTATEIERRRESMHGRASLFREQYGEQGVKPLLGKLLRAALTMRNPATPATYDEATGLRLVQEVLPGVDIPAGLGSVTDNMIKLTWPDWVQRGAADAQAAAGAVATARSASAIDRESAFAYISPFFKIDDPAAALERLAAEVGALDAQMSADMQAAQGPKLDENGQPIPDEPLPQAQVLLNGAQLDALAAYLKSAVLGEIPVEAVKEVIAVAFPFTRQQVEAIMSSVQVRPQQPDAGKPAGPPGAMPGA